jgi:hypothetical protein
MTSSTKDQLFLMDRSPFLDDPEEGCVDREDLMRILGTAFHEAYRTIGHGACIQGGEPLDGPTRPPLKCRNSLKKKG